MSRDIGVKTPSGDMKAGILDSSTFQFAATTDDGSEVSHASYNPSAQPCNNARSLKSPLATPRQKTNVHAANMPLTLTSLFQLPEIAELILIELPIHDLLITAQRINKQWQNIIATSPRLQQALFFQPLPGPLVQLQITSPPPIPWQYAPMQAHFAEDKKHIRVFGNPFIEKINTTRYGRQEDLLRRPEASWRKMLVCQPAIGCISFPPFSESETPFTIERAEGVLLRQALFEDAHIKQGFSGVATELQFFEKLTLAWEVQRVEED